MAALRHAVEQQQLPQVAWLAEHLAAQLEAIAREATAWSLREWTVRHRKLPAGSVNVFSIRILSGGYVKWLPNAEPAWRG
ncbi:primosomal replication protein N [Escherichia coli]|uniref:Primosomal replication protein N n=1 Tax=Escherichia coli TaxID=562 RepID=A0A377DGS3_ECOLX|nr:primosomal replication protein N [Escherichia coli]